MPTEAQKHDPVYNLVYECARDYVQGQEDAEALAALVRATLSKEGYMVVKRTALSRRSRDEQQAT